MKANTLAAKRTGIVKSSVGLDLRYRKGLLGLELTPAGEAEVSPSEVIRDALRALLRTA